MFGGVSLPFSPSSPGLSCAFHPNNLVWPICDPPCLAAFFTTSVSNPCG
jgi:hypothetical protein